jgi:putative toxin-antitoxin system antitoxin component (TIGR02293 family)
MMIEGISRLGPGVAHKIVKRGKSSKSVEPLGRFLGIGKNELAKVLDLDRGTPSRLAAKNKPLPSHAGEGVVRLLEIESLASDVFESEDDAANWLRKPHPMLEGEAPLEAGGSSFGTQRVKDILLAIKYGAAL